MSDSFPACELCLFVCQPARQLRPPSRRATAYRSSIADYTSHALVTLRNEVSEITKQKAKKSNLFLDSGAVSVTSGMPHSLSPKVPSSLGIGGTGRTGYTNGGQPDEVSR